MKLEPIHSKILGFTVFVVLGMVLWSMLAKAEHPRDTVKITEPKSESGLPVMPAQADSAEPQTPLVVVEPEPEPEQVVVHVAGKVKAPGVYTLPSSARIIDAVKAAGGSKPDAVLDAVNLAARLTDGEQIYLPGKSGVPSYVTQPPSTLSQSKFTGARPASGAASVSSKSPSKVNINRAGVEELDTLPGVGPATAASIIEYRKAAGGFARPDDLMNVKGIGPKKYSEMKSFVVVH